jgi:hypothetical protein
MFFSGGGGGASPDADDADEDEEVDADDMEFLWGASGVVFVATFSLFFCVV